MSKIDFFKVYKVLTYIFIPFVWVFMAIRKQKGKEDLSRFNERIGVSRKKRPEGKLLWFHGASVGETLSMRPLIDKILNEFEEVNILITSGTRTSADILKENLPKRVFHQYIPIDYSPYVKRFVSHFKPDVAFWFESEFWPTLLKDAKDNGVKMVLVNGRISDRSFSRWRLFGGIIKQLLGVFDVIIAGSEESKERLKILSGQEVLNFGNLKFSALSNMEIDKVEKSALEEMIGERRVFLAASTHKGEDEKIAEIHKKLKTQFGDILTIISPRHSNRGSDIEKMLKQTDLKVSVRSRNEKISLNTDIYLADTMGEMGIFYSLCKTVFVGGSLIKFGGQNMIEPMSMGDFVLIGPHAFNFRDIVKEGNKKEALIEVKDENELFLKLKDFFSSPEKYQKYCKNAHAYANSFKNIKDNIFNAVRYLIDEDS